MRLRLLSTITVIMLLLLGSPQPVVADPITAWFSVTVTTRNNLQSGIHNESIDSFSFVISATFDDQLTSYRTAFLYSGASFGSVTFTGVPELVGPTPGVIGEGFSLIEREEGRGEVALLGAIVSRPTPRPTDPFTGLTQSKGFYLSKSQSVRDYLLPREDATAARLLSMLSSGTIYMFDTAQVGVSVSPTRRILYDPSSYQYSGTFTQLDSAPVPEPASMLLVATGLMGAAGVRRWKQRRV